MKAFHRQSDLKAKSTGINRTMSGSVTTPTTGGNMCVVNILTNW